MITPKFIIYLLEVLFVSCWGLFHYRKLSKPYKLLTILLTITFISEIITRVLSYTIHNANYEYHVYAPVQLFILSFVYIYSLRKKWLFWPMIVLVIANIINSAFIQKPDTFPTNSMSMNGFFIVFLGLLSIYHFTQNKNKQQEVNMFKNSWFWLDVGNIFFFSALYMFFPMINTLVKNGGIPIYMNYAFWLVSILLYICYFMALHYEIRNTKNI